MKRTKINKRRPGLVHFSKNCWLQQDWNLDCHSWRRTSWPLDHHHISLRTVSKYCSFCNHFQSSHSQSLCMKCSTWESTWFILRELVVRMISSTCHKNLTLEWIGSFGWWSSWLKHSSTDLFGLNTFLSLSLSLFLVWGMDECTKDYPKLEREKWNEIKWSIGC